MNKVITINLHGSAFQLEEAGYEALRTYLDGAARNLEGNPDRDEIIADIEQAIADKCRAVLGAYKNVVVAPEVSQIIAEMGPVQDAAAEGEERPAGGGSAGAAGTAAGAAAGPGAAAAEAAPPPRVRRLYKIREGAMFAGVCNGLGIYFGIDPTLVRLLFVLLTFFWGFAILVYLILMFILPSPETSAEKAAAYGVAATAQEFIRRAREGYYEGMKTWGDRRAHREWRRRFRHEMRGWGRRLKQEVRENAWRAQQQWHQHWTPPNVPPAGCPPPPSFLLLVALPVLALLRGVLAVVGLCALVSLLVTHTAFGLALPANLPLWVAVVLLLVLYCLVAWPLKALRHAWYWHAGRGPMLVPPVFWFADAVVGLGCAVLALWLIDRYVPHAHEAFQAALAMLHQALDAVRQWWASR